MPSLSVLICTYNRHELMRSAMEALVEGTSEKPDEIVIVNGGDERTDHVVESYMGRHGIRIKLVNTINKNLAASRNVGLPQCTCDIVAMTDDDAEVYPDWITQMKRVHVEHPEAGAVGGQIIGADSALDLISRLSDLVTFPSPGVAKTVRTLPGVNVSYKRAALDSVGPQDEILIRSEDVDFNWRVKLAGFSVYYDPSIRVKHHHRPTLRRFLNQHHMYGRGYYLVRRKYPDMYCIYPHQFRTAKDVLKAVNFVAAALYEPFLYARRLPVFSDKVRAVPILMANQFAWRAGIIYQKWLTLSPHLSWTLRVRLNKRASR